MAFEIVDESAECESKSQSTQTIEDGAARGKDLDEHSTLETFGHEGDDDGEGVFEDEGYVSCEERERDEFRVGDKDDGEWEIV